MNFAYQLLVAAMTLLTTVSANPNVSADLKAQATLVANQAIAYAQNVIQEENTPAVSTPVVQTPVQTPVQNTPAPTPVFGSTQPVSAPIINTPVVPPSPTCTLVASSTVVDNIYHIGDVRFSGLTGSVGWTSENATGGTLYLIGNGREYAYPIISLSNGYRDNFDTDNSYSYKAIFTGNGSVTCIAQPSYEQKQKAVQDAYDQCKSKYSERLDLCSYWAEKVSNTGGIL